MCSRAFGDFYWHFIGNGKPRLNIRKGVSHGHKKQISEGERRKKSKFIIHFFQHFEINMVMMMTVMRKQMMMVVVTVMVIMM